MELKTKSHKLMVELMDQKYNCLKKCIKQIAKNRKMVWIESYLFDQLLLACLASHVKPLKDRQV